MLPCFCPKLTTMLFLLADYMLELTKEYGNTFQLRLLTDNVVRVLSFVSGALNNLRLQVLTVEPHHVKVLEPSRLHICY
jgi:hypothetical protein